MFGAGIKRVVYERQREKNLVKETKSIQFLKLSATCRSMNPFSEVKNPLKKGMREKKIYNFVLPDLLRCSTIFVVTRFSELQDSQAVITQRDEP